MNLEAMNEEELWEQHVKAVRGFEDAFIELRQFVWEKCLGTPEMPIQPTPETLERLLLLTKRAKEACDRMIEASQ